MRNYDNTLVEELMQERVQLKQQLAEKDAELNRYAELFGMKDKDFYVVEKSEYEKMKQGAKQFANEKAIAELEKVKEWLEPKYFDNEQITYLTKIIDNQIKALKEGK